MRALVPICAVAVGGGLAVAIATGALEVPNLAQALSDAVARLGWWVFLAAPALVFLETSAFVGFMIHGELALLAGGLAAAEHGYAALVAMIALAWAAAVAGDVVSLWAGRSLGRPFLARHGARVRLDAAQVAAVDGFFARHGGKALFLSRFNGFSRATTPFVAGTSGVSVRRLVPFSAASALVWTTAFVVIGYAAAESFERVGDTASRVALVALLVVAVALIVRGRLRTAPAPDPGSG